METSSRITPKGTQPQVKQKEVLQPSLEGKSAPSDFVLSADAPPYTPQPTTAKQVLNSNVGPCVLAESSGLGFIRTFPAAPQVQEEEYLQQRSGATPPSYLGAAPLGKSAELRGALRADSATAPPETQLQSVSAVVNRKVAGNLIPLAASSNVPLKFCKFLIGEDVAGFLVGRKGVGG